MVAADFALCCSLLLVASLPDAREDEGDLERLPADLE